MTVLVTVFCPIVLPRPWMLHVSCQNMKFEDLFLHEMIHSALPPTSPRRNRKGGDQQLVSVL